MSNDTVTEDDCEVCSAWPTADRASLSREHFSTDYIRIPTKAVCERCQMTFWANMTGVEYTDEQLEEALQQGRASARQGHEALGRLRARSVPRTFLKPPTG